MKIKYLFIIPIVLTTLIFSSCTVTINGDGYKNSNDTGHVGETKTETKVIEKDGEDELKVNLEFGVGKFHIEGGTDKLADAEFIYNIPEWKPIVDYSKNGSKGILKISQQGTKNMNGGNIKNEWNIKLNKDLPLSLDVEAGVGNCDLNLSNTNLKDLVVEAGVGNTNVDASGDYKSDVDVKIEGGVGNITLYVPKNMGVRVKAEKGLGKIRVNGFKSDGDNFVNDSYGNSKNKMNVNIEAGVGNIKVEQK